MRPSLARPLITALSGTAAIALTSAIVVPADAADTGLTYTCTTPDSPSDQSYVVKSSTNAPATMYVGQSKQIKRTSTMIVGTNGLGGDVVTGTEVVKDTFGSRAVTSTLRIQRTVLPDSGNVDLTGTGTTTYRPTAPGTVALRAVQLNTTAIISDAGGNVLNISAISCLPPAGADATFDTITVKKDATRTTVAPSGKGRRVTAKLTVKGVHGGAATGKVTVAVKKGRKTVEKKVASVTAGKVTVKLPKKLRKGRYVVKATYAGTPGFSGSAGSHSVRVR